MWFAVSGCAEHNLYTWQQISIYRWTMLHNSCTMSRKSCNQEVWRSLMHNWLWWLLMIRPHTQTHKQFIDCQILRVSFAEHVCRLRLRTYLSEVIYHGLPWNCIDVWWAPTDIILDFSIICRNTDLQFQHWTDYAEACNSVTDVQQCTGYKSTSSMHHDATQPRLCHDRPQIWASLSASIHFGYWCATVDRQKMQGSL